MLAVAAALLVGPGAAGGTDTGGVAQCVRAEGARFLNTRADRREAARGARRFALGFVTVRSGTTVFVWQRDRGAAVHRVYLLWPGRHTGARRRAARMVRRLSAHPHHAWPYSVLLSDTRGIARRIDRVCLHRSGG